MKFQTSIAVENDIEEIVEYIARDSTEAAARMARTFAEIFERIAEMPGIGRSRGDLMNGLRSFPSGPYTIFYLVDGEGVLFFRVVHGARDLEALFSSN